MCEKRPVLVFCCTQTIAGFTVSGAIFLLIKLYLRFHINQGKTQKIAPLHFSCFSGLVNGLAQNINLTKGIKDWNRFNLIEIPYVWFDLKICNIIFKGNIYVDFMTLPDRLSPVLYPLLVYRLSQIYPFYGVLYGDWFEKFIQESSVYAWIYYTILSGWQLDLYAVGQGLSD